MEKTITLNDWDLKITDRKIILSGFQFTPAESNKITRLIGFAGSMADLKALPAQIEDSPFVIEFSEVGELKLLREDSEEVINFNFDETDSLIETVKSACDIAIDIQKIQPSVIPRGTIGPEPADWFDGKA